MYNSVWYNNLLKPFLTPKASVFPVAWTILYILIFIALFLYFKTKIYKNKLRGYIYFIIQFILNIVWSPIFFIYKKIDGALLVIILLDIFVFLTIKEFYKVSKSAAYFLIPYFLWILFATYLNAGFFILNNKSVISSVALYFAR